MRINPDFRTVDEVEPELPANVAELQGWSDGESATEAELLYQEQQAFDAVQSELPERFESKRDREFDAEILSLWNTFQKSKGRYSGSADWSLIDEFFAGEMQNGTFVAGAPLLWKPQIIGSCVTSNTFRPWVTRLMIQIILFGDPMEYLGRNEFGPRNLAFYGPWSYGHARKKANMRRGDGLYCAPMTWSLMQGVLSCNTPALTQILAARGLDNPADYPEPQGRDGASFYRAMGNWQHIDELEPYIDFPMSESPRVTSADQLWNLLQKGKPAFVCSMEAIHKIGEHPDGFPIHARNRRDRWAHNMSVQGCFVASDGERFFRWCNQSWGERHIYNRRLSEVDQAFRGGGLTMQSIGQIDGPNSTPPAMV